MLSYNSLYDNTIVADPEGILHMNEVLADILIDVNVDLLYLLYLADSLPKNGRIMQYTGEVKKIGDSWFLLSDDLSTLGRDGTWTGGQLRISNDRSVVKQAVIVGLQRDENVKVKTQILATDGNTHWNIQLFSPDECHEIRKKLALAGLISQ